MGEGPLRDVPSLLGAFSASLPFLDGRVSVARMGKSLFKRWKPFGEIAEVDRYSHTITIFSASDFRSSLNHSP